MRELTGPSRVLGNHVVLELTDGSYAVVAHLRRRSVGVAVGQQVRSGAQLGECGNSGNTAEPHVHFQRMDRRRAWLAAGLPFTFVDVRIEDPSQQSRPGDVPANMEPFLAGPVPDPAADPRL